ncbi:MAG TPA: hypothetical protein VH482_35440 [Thermomicrobiales bacterium]|jgi:hypothetical protein
MDEEQKPKIDQELDLEDLIGSLPALPNASPDFEREIDEAMEEALLRELERLGMWPRRPDTEPST